MLDITWAQVQHRTDRTEDSSGLKNTQRWEFLVLFGSTGAQASLGDLRCPRQSLEGIILGIYIISPKSNSASGMAHACTLVCCTKCSQVSLFRRAVLTLPIKENPLPQGLEVRGRTRIASATCTTYLLNDQEFQGKQLEIAMHVLEASACDYCTSVDIVYWIGQKAAIDHSRLMHERITGDALLEQWSIVKEAAWSFISCMLCRCNHEQSKL